MRKSASSPNQLPLFVPDATWICPTELPDLRGHKELSFDTETRDMSLSVGRGPGCYTKAGYVVGVSLAWDGGSIYIPIRHPDTNNFDHTQVGLWLKDLFGCPQIRWVLHNAGYDFSWCKAEWGLEPPAIIEDTGALAALVDENRFSYSLDSLCSWRGLPGKDEKLLKEAAAAYGFADSVKANLWKLPAKFSAPYAEQDAVATLGLAASLRPEIVAQGLEEACRVEMGLIPMVMAMSQKGVKINTGKAEQVRDKLIQRRDIALQELSDELHINISMDEINSARHIETWLTKYNIPFARTEKSKQGKFDSDFLDKHTHPLPKKISFIRQIDSAQSKFLQGFLLDFASNGRIHSSINQFRNEGGGTRSHRFSYDSPPLQQMPSRDSTPLKEELATEIRGCFEPEAGELWGSHDLSQQEYRIIVHFAELLHCRRAELAGNKYREDPSTDFHEFVVSLTRLSRKRAKDCNFAVSFGAGDAKFALMADMSLQEAKEVRATYDEELPFVKEASDKCKRVAEQRGYIRLLDGARSRFDFWECSHRDWEEEKKYKGEEGCAPCSLEQAQRRIENPNHPWKGRLVRAYAHKSFNRLVQGSAARQVKKAMLDCFKEGYLPLLQIHDELCFSHSDESQGKRINELMRDAIKLTVPMRCDSEYGTSWGTARVVKNKNKEVVYGATWAEAQRLQAQGKWW